MKKYKLLSFPQLGDERGGLIVVEGLREIPFEIKRVFCIYGTKDDVVRGQHANRKSEFVLINLAGHCKIRVDDGKAEEIVVLDKPHEGIYLDKMVWKDMYDFSPESVLLVLSNCGYDAEEYVRDYVDFKKEVSQS